MPLSRKTNDNLLHSFEFFRIPSPEIPSFSNLLKEIGRHFKSLHALLLLCAQKSLKCFLPDLFKRDFLTISLGIWGTLFLTAILCQSSYWGDPTPFLDQQYYLFGGGQILQGRIPYVDFWDCKPVGLFLLFSFIRLFDPYQYYVLPILSSLFLFAGALGLYKLGTLISRKAPAFCIAFAYLLLNTFYGVIADGQSEQFFVPIVIWAIYLFFLEIQKEQTKLRNLFLTGSAVMLLFGIALEIKPSCIFEGILTGLSLLYAIFLRKNLSKTRKCLYATFFGLVWVFLALLPTLLIMGWYFEHHYFSDWLFANLQSNTKRLRWMTVQKYNENYLKHVIRYGFLLCCVSLCALFLLKNQAHNNTSSKTRFLSLFILLWTIITLITGIILRGGFDSFHYMEPAMPPLLILSAILWEQEGFLKYLISCLFLSGCFFILKDKHPLSFEERGKTYYHLQKLMQEQPGCLFELSGFSGSLFFNATKASASCDVSKYLFPDFLFDPQYRFSLQINPEQELQRILATRPLYLIMPAPPETQNCAIKNTCEDKDSLWVENVFPQREWQLLQKTLKSYTPLYLEEHHWGFYKLKPGLVPNITPPNVQATPALPIIFPAPEKEDKKFKKRLQALKEAVSKWPEPQ